MDLEIFNEAVRRLGKQAQQDIAWSENVGLPVDAEDFASEAIFVICNSGMKNTVAREIYKRVMSAIGDGRPVSTAFGHKGKCEAIDAIWRDRERLYAEFMTISESERVEWLGHLPWIGDITKFHLAKNFGVDCVKPDVHLARLAKALGTDPDTLCGRLAGATGYRKATIDLLIWRACANGVVSSHTGELCVPTIPEPAQEELAI